MRIRTRVIAAGLVLCVLVVATAGAEEAGRLASRVACLRGAVEDLMETFGDRYPLGQQYLERLGLVDASGFDELQREALLDNPLVSGQPLLFVVRGADTVGTHEYMLTHAYRGRGGALKLLDVKTGRTQTLVSSEEGIVRSPCVDFDGRRIVFTMSRGREPHFHIFEIDAELAVGGAGERAMRQLTFEEDVSDVDPIYMTDGSIAFASTREIKYVPCDTQLVPQMFRMSGDGSNIHQITRSTAHENQLSLTPDGRILYSRWDYVDRNFGDGHGFWVANPDGTNPSLIWGNNTTHPSAGWFPRNMAGTSRLLCILGTHHGSLGGALAILDPQRAIEGGDSVVRTWPAEVKGRFGQQGESRLERDGNASVRQAVGAWSEQTKRLWSEDSNMRMHRHDDNLANVRPWYNTPWPLSEKYFLCVRADSRDERTSIYLVDVFGNEVLVHEEEPGCFSPMPLAVREKPISVPSKRDYGNSEGLFYIQNVYRGTHMQGVEPGSVKRIRVVEVMSKRGRSEGAGWNGLGMQTPAMNWTEFNAKQILGTAPVEEDGSAYFEVPSDRFVYFQLLDGDGMMIQSMRSGTMVHSGETLSCGGCHESRATTNALTRRTQLPTAARRAASKLEPWYGPTRRFSYLEEVQPVLDKHCVRCHDFGKDGGKKLVLAGDRTASFNVSYMELWRKGYLDTIGAGPAGHLPAYSWGSHGSRLIAHLRKGHEDVKLDSESLDRLITWVDLNGPYYSTTYCAYPHNPPGRCPLDRKELAALGGLGGFSVNEVTRSDACKGPMISFDRPEMSPCLVGLKDSPAKYAEALAIIRKGQSRLQERPRADMAGFVPWEKDRWRQSHRAKYLAIEMDTREAIRQNGN